mmetsp:Transcript_17188/g.37374  ORF Transcript_17188/g.37374 Transcript_17188/m.37374 type:complete len:363 (-) Transcript_17188:367-1455(-)
MHGYDDSDSSDDESEPMLYVRGKETPATESFIKFVNKATVKQPVTGVQLVYQATELPRKAKPKFDHSTYFHKLHTTSLGNVLMATTKLPSTQTFMKQHSPCFPVGAVLVADQQNKGRGRGENTWTSPMGCLMFSFNTQVTDGTTLPFLQYVAALSIVQGIQNEAALSLQQHLGALDFHAVDCRIKWPNDVYSGNDKIGGVICESTYDMDTKKFIVTLGCGINVANQMPTTCVQTMVKERAAQLSKSSSGVQRPRTMSLPPLPGREAVLGAIMTQMERNLDTFQEEGFAALKPQYLQHWMHSHTTVSLTEADKRGTRVKVALVIKGLTQSGYLLAEDQAGQKYELHPDGNSLDFFSGLVRKKI